jgi:hypothetical protein
MTPFTSKQELLASLRQKGLSVERLDLDQGFNSMIDFYREIRGEKCSLSEERDMLLYEWGTFDWGKVPSFQISLTRQFILPGSDADDPDGDVMSQLKLSFHCEPNSELRALTLGNRWCRSPDEIAEFQSFVETSPAFLKASSIRSLKTVLDYHLV